MLVSARVDTPSPLHWYTKRLAKLSQEHGRTDQQQALDQRLALLHAEYRQRSESMSPYPQARARGKRHAWCSALRGARRLSIHAIMVLRSSSLPGSLIMTCQRFGMMCSSLSVDAARS